MSAAAAPGNMLQATRGAISILALSFSAALLHVTGGRDKAGQHMLIGLVCKSASPLAIFLAAACDFAVSLNACAAEASLIIPCAGLQKVCSLACYVRKISNGFIWEQWSLGREIAHRHSQQQRQRSWDGGQRERDGVILSGQLVSQPSDGGANQGARRCHGLPQPCAEDELVKECHTQYLSNFPQSSADYCGRHQGVR